VGRTNLRVNTLERQHARLSGVREHLLAIHKRFAAIYYEPFKTFRRGRGVQVIDRDPAGVYDGALSAH